MACARCNQNHDSNNCPQEISFRLDGSVLYGRCGAVPIEPLDLSPLVDGAETDTSLELDIPNKQLIYNSENQKSYVSAVDIANLLSITDLADVDYQVATDGDVLSWDNDKKVWESYTVPSGTIDTVVGVDADGLLVKQGSPTTPIAADTVPLGGIMIYPAAVTNLGPSYKECNGQALSRTVYSNLYDLIGTTYGVGDGTTTFNLPDMQTRVVAGLSSTDTQFDTIGETGGSKKETLSTAELPPHHHSANPPKTYTNTTGSHRHQPNNGTDYGFLTYKQTSSVERNKLDKGNYKYGYAASNRNDLGYSGVTAYSGDHKHSLNIPAFNTANTGSGDAHNNLQPFMVMPYIMRVL